MVRCSIPAPMPEEAVKAAMEREAPDVDRFKSLFVLCSC